MGVAHMTGAPSRTVRAAILQAKWTGDTASMIEVHESHARAAAVLGMEAARPIEGEPPSLHAGRFDVGPLVIDIARHGERLWLESPAPGPRGELVRVGPASYALNGDPWGVAVHFECTADDCSRIRLHMAGMEWAGQRVGP